MKKFAYLFVFMIAIMLTSCKSCNPDPKTLEELYPDWANLTWVSTDSLLNYPRLNITIVDDLGTINQSLNDTQSYNDTFTKITISGDNITFSEPANVTGLFVKNGSQIKLYTNGLSLEGHFYVLQIN